VIICPNVSHYRDIFKSLPCSRHSSKWFVHHFPGLRSIFISNYNWRTHHRPIFWSFRSIERYLSKFLVSESCRPRLHEDSNTFCISQSVSYWDSNDLFVIFIVCDLDCERSLSCLFCSCCVVSYCLETPPWKRHLRIRSTVLTNFMCDR
jgi:hypothetical protein